MKYHIYIKDWEDYEYCERQNGKYRPVIIEASSQEEAVKIFLTERGWEDDGLTYAISDKRYKKIMEEEQKLRDLGYSSWDEYYEDLYPARPIQL